MSKQLNSVSKDENVIIQSFENEELSIHCQSLGFLEGSLIKVISKLPFKGAIICESKNTRIALRADDAAQIKVIPK